MSESIVNEDTLSQVVEAVWDQVLELPVRPTAPPADESTPDLSVCVHITGGWNGAVLFWPSDRFAGRASARLFAIAETEVTPADVQDAMAELGNIVAGNLKSILPGPSALSLPTVTHGHQHEVFVRRTRLVAQYTFVCEDETLSIRLLEGLPAPQAVVAHE